MENRDKQEWRLHLDEGIALRLRDAVNEDTPSIRNTQKPLKKKNSKVYPVWNRTCALLDRIEDIVAHINGIVVQKDPYERTAFSFLDLLNHSAVLVDCVYEIARIFEIDTTDYEQSTEIFRENGTDKKYFEYLRSLCSLHPIETSHHREFQTGDFECCPFVGWNDPFFDSPGDLTAHIYTDRHKDHYKTQPIFLCEVLDYIRKMYTAIDSRIIPGIRSYQESIRNRHRATLLKTADDFTTFVDYLDYLGDEGEKRIGCDREYYINEAIRFFEVEFDQPQNQLLLTKYRNALKLAIGFHHSCLQNVSYQGSENTGIFYPCDNWETTLLDLLLRLDSQGELANKHGYALHKAYELIDANYATFYITQRLGSVRPFLEQYVVLDEADTNLKYYVLVRLALYADCLDNKNMLNQNIPNELTYRLCKLDSRRWAELHTEPQREESDVSVEEYLELIEKYSGRNSQNPPS